MKLDVRNGVDLLRRENFTPTNASKICSKHFDDECFDRMKFGGTWLKADAKPIIFFTATYNAKKGR
ncbi:unnamed protein product [Larinioides sclopetarius]|uniref:THAP-type domain-containing protein n=1 Tax=Larinioides sclopetarius TaxID=280406 RepID=A0AAV1Z7K8_9ARAC